MEIKSHALKGEVIVAFTLNGIRNFNGIKMANHIGTGTLKDYRGKGLETNSRCQTFEFASDRFFHYRNGIYESGDAEYWYNIIRLKKPERILEIGSGNSTKIACLAIDMNKKNTNKQI